MNISDTARPSDTQRVLQTWQYEGVYGGRIVVGDVEKHRYHCCDSNEGVKKLATALGGRFDRIEHLAEPVHWFPGQINRTKRVGDNLVDAIVSLTTSRRNASIQALAALSPELRLQFIEHCHDLVLHAARTMARN